MALVLVLGAVATGLVGPNRPAIEAEFGLSHFQFGLGLAAIQVVFAAAVLLAAGWLRQHHPVSVLRWALAVLITGLVICGTGTTLWQLVLGWSITIVGTMLTAIANNVSMDLWPHNPRRGVVLLHAWNAVGKFVGPLIAAGLLLVGWRMSFLAVAVVPALLLLGAGTIPKRSSGVHFEPARPTDTHTFALPKYWCALAGTGMISGGEAAFVTLLPTYFVHRAGMTESAASLLLSAHLVGLVTGRFAVAFMGDRLSNNRVLALCLGAGLCVFPAILAETLVIRLPALILMGLMFSSTWPTFYAQAASHLRDHRHMLAYGTSLGNQVGIAGCVLLSSYVADQHLTASMWFGPAVLWAFGLLYVASGLSKPAD